MLKFDIDYNNLNKKKTFKLSEVKHKLEKVAFDVVKFKDNDIAGLWKIDSSEDGDYIIALYEEQPVKTASLKSAWEIIVGKDNSVNIFYKNFPITKVAASELGIDISEINLIKSYLPSKLASNNELVKSLFKEIKEVNKKDIFANFPELAAQVK